MKKAADIFINIPVKTIAKSFTYIIPTQFKFVQKGCRVVVPFGPRKIEGFVVNIYSIDQKPSNQPLKEIADVIDTEPYFTNKILQTAQFIADFYLCSFGEALRLFIPGKNSIKLRRIYKTVPVKKLLSGQEKLIYDFISSHPGSDLKQIQTSFSDRDIAISMKSLLENGSVIYDYSYKNRTKKIYENYIQINKNIVTPELLKKISRKRKQKEALEFLSDGKLHNINELYNNNFSRNIIKALLTDNYILLIKKQIFRNSYCHIIARDDKKINLTTEQQAVMNTINPFISQSTAKTFLLHGVTGSGKTQIYIETARSVLSKNRQALILVPEIVLTGQLVFSLKKYFADEVVVIHSRLTISERNDAFTRIRTNNARVIIGARSAIFAPFADLGLIVMDEEHDASYKQDESPRYHTRDIAEKMSQLYNAVLILGSATPSIESYFNAIKGKYTLLTMPHRIDNRPLPQIKCIDMREELKLGNHHILSRPLAALIENTLTQKQQIIIMLNRRGYSTFVMCRSCGLVIKCPQCGLPLVYHRGNYLQCHHCDIRMNVPDVCPSCQSHYIKYFGSGTEKLEQELKETFPDARVIRLDRDTTGKKMAQQKILTAFKTGNYDILLGTQMVAKGHDIPNVTAVGIISADASLNMPDFRAPERCFGLITQTAGRAGRGKFKGHVIVQSYNPDHYAVLAGIKQNYDEFYNHELKLRRELFYPPFAKLIKLTIQNEQEIMALKKADKIRNLFKENFTDSNNYQIIGPAPSVIANFRGIYRFNLLIKTTDQIEVCLFLRKLNLDTDKEVKIDINPLNTM
ncbi:primosomal protein N' [Pectinatus sottacetonis]|uniref:primosomal protein N' n=1 Tax=Pectinatus sottacetonis TaxID=1002795 RepID=UPI0018C7CB51|nr:primosomal protein N' [Pectinatus sottacetonis]